MDRPDQNLDVLHRPILASIGPNRPWLLRRAQIISLLEKLSGCGSNLVAGPCGLGLIADGRGKSALTFSVLRLLPRSPLLGPLASILIQRPVISYLYPFTLTLNLPFVSLTSACLWLASLSLASLEVPPNFEGAMATCRLQGPFLRFYFCSSCMVRTPSPYCLQEQTPQAYELCCS